MPIMQILMLCGGAGLVLVVAFFVLNGPNPTKAAARRLSAVRERHSANAIDRVEAQLKKVVAARKPPAHRIAGSASWMEALALRLHRTGKNWSIIQYAQASGGLALGVAVVVYILTQAAVLALCVSIIVGAGLPHMVIGWMIKRRGNKFTAKFPDAIELLVRGLRSGLPVTETLVVVGHEVPGPVGEEFKMITERIKIGRTMEDALQETADRLNMPEFSFFCITLAIQRETGGNLAETLANLADVLRKRSQMKLKIKAMSSESKASAYIVGALPFMVFIMVYMSNPQYLSGFFHEDRLIVAGLGGLTWMSIGVFVMAKMCSFEI